jgi:hypothetical protein
VLARLRISPPRSSIALVRALVTAYLAGSVVGAVHSVRTGRHARFAGVRLPGSPAAHALTIGSPLSAPPVMLLALVIAQRSRRYDVIAALSVLFMIGIAAEADTAPTLSHPRQDRLRTACVALDLVLPAAMLLAARRSVKAPPHRV